MHIEREQDNNKNYVLFIFLSFSLLFSKVEININDDAPTFFLRTLEGKKFYLSQKLEEDRALVFDFFATWCDPCIEEMPLTDSLNHIYPNIDFYFINVSNISKGKKKHKEDPLKVKELIDRLKIKTPVLLDKYGLVFEKYDAQFLPRLVIINKDGKIEYLHRGKYSADIKKIYKILDSLNNDVE